MHVRQAIAAAGAALVAQVGARSLTQAVESGYGYISYETVTGYFLQDETSTDPSTFNYYDYNFGLINRTYPASKGTTGLTQWQKFKLEIDALNANAKNDTVYKILFLGRHGEGYHNAAQTYYGTPDWNCYEAMLNGNATVTWFDAKLDPNGIAQAELAHNYWASEFVNQKIQPPQSYYTSPLQRCLETANITFNGLSLPSEYPFIPTIKELLREGISIHTCDHRHDRSYIHNLFPTWKFDDGFTNFDLLWDGVTAETSTAQAARSKKWLDEVFASDDNTWLSITSHSGEIASTLSVLGHIPFSLNTGAIIPVLVKAQYLPKKDAPATTSWMWTVSTHCAAPPQTSNASLAQGCVCTGKQTAVTTPLVKVTNTRTQGPTVYPGPSFTAHTSTKAH